MDLFCEEEESGSLFASTPLYLNLAHSFKLNNHYFGGAHAAKFAGADIVRLNLVLKSGALRGRARYFVLKKYISRSPIRRAPARPILSGF